MRQEIDIKISAVKFGFFLGLGLIGAILLSAFALALLHQLALWVIK